jgi:ABC-type glycerol-3-phosphate transport system permease component
VNWRWKAPSPSNTWMRRLLRSATYTRPLASTAMLWGVWNCPGPVPRSPHDLSQSPSLLTLATRELWSKIGLTNSYVPLIVPHWLGFHVFYIFLLRQFFKNLPRELDEAAIIDGAHVLQVFWFLVLPLSRPALIVVAILSALFAWNDFLDPLVYISDGDKYTLALGLTQFTGLFTSQWNLLMAATTVIIVPVLLVFFLTQRYFIAGVTMSGLKG